MPLSPLRNYGFSRTTLFIDFIHRDFLLANSARTGLLGAISIQQMIPDHYPLSTDGSSRTLFDKRKQVALSRSEIV